jgi:hypothetical protein
MDFKRFNISPMVSNILLIIVIACSAAVMYTINQIDQIINVNLYDYGLTGDAGWSVPYQNFKWIAYGSLTGTIIVCAAVMALGFLKIKQEQETNAAPKEKQPIYQTIPESIISQRKIEEPKPIITSQKSQPEKEQKEKKNKISNKQVSTTTTSSTANGVCPACKKSYSQSLVMLDFEDGKSKLVNVCPNCNHILGDSEQKTQ